MTIKAQEKLHGFKNRLQKATGIQILLLSMALCGLIVISACMGYIHLSFIDVAKIIFAKMFGQTSLLEGMDEILPVVVIDVRLPRILTAAVVGGGLAVSGAVFQGILLNPLADPYTLGVSAGAAFGASLAFFFNIVIFDQIGLGACFCFYRCGRNLVFRYLSFICKRQFFFQ